MTDEPTGQVTRLLVRIESGNARAADELLPLVYAELRRLARARVAREREGHEVQPTSLVHEVYLRLVGDQQMQWANRAHFFSAAAEAMRRILIEKARRRGRLRRGGGRVRVTLDEDAAVVDTPPEELLALDEALTRLEQRDARMADVVKLRCFAGLTIPETARALETSESTVKRQIDAATVWLRREMTRES